MKNILILILLLTSITFSMQIEDLEKDRINHAIDQMYLENFEVAESIFYKIRDRYPDHPIGDFMMGTYYNYLAVFYETDKFDSKITIYYRNVEKKSRFHIDQGNTDPWYKFYLGASLVNKGYLLGRNKSYFKGLRLTSKGISYIEDCSKKNNNIGDALLLLGSYNYYKGSLLSWSWIWDNRTEGIAMMKKSIDTSYFSKYLGISTLGWAYIDYKKFDKALELANTALKKYPNSHFFLFLKARALFEQKNYALAIDYYQTIIEKLMGFNETYSNVDLFNSYYFLSISFQSLGNKIKARSYYDLAIKCDLTVFEKERLEDRIDDLKDIFE
jgi:tetratricopeptide (TPR) repeat protein